jgi:FkbM family methyltransferase
VALQLSGAGSSRRVQPDAKNEHRREAIPVPMTTLDRLCADWSRVDPVKIDAEGAESLVWDGMQQMLKRFPHAVVLVYGL